MEAIGVLAFQFEVFILREHKQYVYMSAYAKRFINTKLAGPIKLKKSNAPQ